MSKAIIFLGPSLPVSEAKQIFDADYRPPVRRGDVAEAAREKPPLIGIIDGVFMHTLTPSPHEVLRVIEGGTKVLGSSSLGALRAAELHPYGMIGVGAVFSMFRSRRLVADDEVAVVLSSEDYRALSEPMVNIRYGLAAAARAGVITARERAALVRLGKELYFPERSWKRLFLEAKRVLPAKKVARLDAFVKRGDYDLKGHDAKRLLVKAKQMVARQAS